MYYLQKRHTECKTMAQEALSIAETVGVIDTLFNTKLLMNRLRLALHEIELETAVKELEVLLNEWSDEAEQAALHYEIWYVDPTRTNSREAAANLYRTLYEHIPNIMYRQRYGALTGEQLPSSTSLPPLPDYIHDTVIDLPSLLRRAGVQF